jgi:NAD(P) transhydrogenase subunit alpha
VRIAVLAETAEGERRVAAVPETVRAFVAAGSQVSVQAGAGRGSYVADEAYAAAGSTIVDAVADLVGDADVVLSAQPAAPHLLAMLRPGAAIISMLAPTTYRDQVRAARDARLTSFALELVPRITRAQAMDVLSSQALVAGYRAALAAAERLPGLFPMITTAAGTVPAARVLVLGTGVAGLSAIATARRLGAATSAYDVRPTAADEVRSLGATFLPLELATQDGVAAGGYARVQSDEFLAAQRSLLGECIGEFDAVITTAAVPGQRAPLLVTAEMVERMRPGSVLVDLAAEAGGNCGLTRAGEEVAHHGVVIYGPMNLASEASRHASELFARNVLQLVLLMTNRGEFAPDFADEIVAGCCVTRGGEVVHPAARAALGEVTDSTVSTTVPGSSSAGEPRARSLDRPGVRRGTVDEAAQLLVRSRTVVVVPGYGLAVAQGQHALRVLAQVLAERGIEVDHALHPVAGRLPGHLNVLLDEAGVAGTSVQDLDEANEAFPRTDVVLVVGANDVVNPAARTAPGSPIYGLPILDVGGARHVVVLTRSPGPGFAGVDNPLFSDGRTMMLFGDVRDTLIGLITAVRTA